LPQAQQAEIRAVPGDSVAETMVQDIVEAEGAPEPDLAVDVQIERSSIPPVLLNRHVGDNPLSAVAGLLVTV